jgi:diadenosine tetraphosphate (Ap4A) HIT family hydrolase
VPTSPIKSEPLSTAYSTPLTSACPLCTRVAHAHTDPALLANFGSCIAILGDNQGPRGWCTLITTTHHEHLDHLTAAAQQELFGHVARVARAIRTVFATSGAGGGPPRLNYECLGNVCPHIHWHIIPRHAADPTPNATVWGWDAATLAGTRDHFTQDAAALRSALTRNVNDEGVL